MKNKKGIISRTLYYPAIFLKSKKGGYEIFFPDFVNSATCGRNLQDGMYMGSDYIGAVLHDDILKGFAREKGIDEEEAEHVLEESFVTLVPFNPMEYLRNVEQRTVRRNVTLPYWMNEAAKNCNINFSKTLQDALMNKLNLDEESE